MSAMALIADTSGERDSGVKVFWFFFYKKLLAFA